MAEPEPISNYVKKPTPDNRLTRQSVHFLDVQADDCRAIISYCAKGYAEFCGQPKNGRSSYCEAHHQLFHQPT